MVSIIAIVTNRLHLGVDFIDPEYFVTDWAYPNTV